MLDFSIQIGDDEIRSAEVPGFLAMLQDARALIRGGGTITVADSTNHVMFNGLPLNMDLLDELVVAIHRAVEIGELNVR